MEIIKSNQSCHQTLSAWDRLTGGIWPYYGTVNWYPERIDPGRLRCAIQQMIDSYPIFSGRLRSKRGKLQVLCDKDSNGVELHTYVRNSENAQQELSGKTIDIPVELEVPSRSLYALGRDKPLVYIILYTGKDCGGIGVLINHLIADGSTYFAFVEKLSDLYCGILERSDSVFSYSMDAVDQFFKESVIGHTFKERILYNVSAGVFMVRMFFRRQSRYDVLWFAISDEEQEQLKSEYGSYSRNDALFEFLCVSPAKVCGFPSDLRGVGHYIGNNHGGNATSLVSATTKACNQWFVQHSDIREAINRRSNCHLSLRFRGFGIRSYFVHNSWNKFQDRLPKLVNNSSCQSVFLNPQNICFQLMWCGSLVLKTTNKKSLVFYSNKKPNVSKLEIKLKSLGFEVMKLRDN